MRLAIAYTDDYFESPRDCAAVVQACEREGMLTDWMGTREDGTIREGCVYDGERGGLDFRLSTLLIDGILYREELIGASTASRYQDWMGWLLAIWLSCRERAGQRATARLVD